MTEPHVTTEKTAPYAHLHIFERHIHAKYERIMMRIDSTYNAVCERADLEREQRDVKTRARFDQTVSASYTRYKNSKATDPRAYAKHSDREMRALSVCDRAIEASGDIYCEISRKASLTRLRRYRLLWQAYKNICDRAGMKTIY